MGADGAGGLLFGRTTYELLGSSWPTVGPDAAETDRAIADRLNALPKYVLSSSPVDLGWGPAERIANCVPAHVIPAMLRA